METATVIEIVSVEGAARLFGITRQGLARQLKAGTALVQPFARLGKRLYFDKSAVERAVVIRDAVRTDSKR
jgi:hypothetical protein